MNNPFVSIPSPESKSNIIQYPEYISFVNDLNSNLEAKSNWSLIIPPKVSIEVKDLNLEAKSNCSLTIPTTVPIELNNLNSILEENSNRLLTIPLTVPSELNNLNSNLEATSSCPITIPPPPMVNEANETIELNSNSSKILKSKSSEKMNLIEFLNFAQKQLHSKPIDPKNSIHEIKPIDSIEPIEPIKVRPSFAKHELVKSNENISAAVPFDSKDNDNFGPTINFDTSIKDRSIDLILKRADMLDQINDNEVCIKEELFDGNVEELSNNPKMDSQRSDIRIKQEDDSITLNHPSKRIFDQQINSTIENPNNQISQDLKIIFNNIKDKENQLNIANDNYIETVRQLFANAIEYNLVIFARPYTDETTTESMFLLDFFSQDIDDFVGNFIISIDFLHEILSRNMELQKCFRIFVDDEYLEFDSITNNGTVTDEFVKRIRWCFGL